MLLVPHLTLLIVRFCRATAVPINKQRGALNSSHVLLPQVLVEILTNLQLYPFTIQLNHLRLHIALNTKWYPDDLYY